jgi:hypothetical protein
MDHIIAYRINGGRLEFVLDPEGDVCVFSGADTAISYADGNALFRSGRADYQIIELDEL